RLMGAGQDAVALKGAAHGTGVGLVAGSVEESTAIVTADVVSMRGDGATVVRDIRPRGTRFQDGVRDLEWRGSEDAAAAAGSGIAGNCAVADNTASDDTAAAAADLLNHVPGDGAVGNGRAATDSATVKVSPIPADGTVGNSRAAINPATNSSVVTANGAVG